MMPQKKKMGRPRVVRNDKGEKVLIIERDDVTPALSVKNIFTEDNFLEIAPDVERESNIDFSCVLNKVITDIDFSYTNFSDYDIRGFIFKGCDFTGADFTNSCLQGVLFEKCNLKDIITAGADLRWSSLDASSNK